MGFLPLILFGGATFFAWRNHRQSATPPPLISWVKGKPRLSPDWWPHVADELADWLPVGQQYAHDPENDPYVLAWHVLYDHVPASVGGLPPEPYAPRGPNSHLKVKWQTRDPDAPGFWSGRPEVWELMVRVAWTIQNALPHWFRTGEMILRPQDVGPVHA